MSQEEISKIPRIIYAYENSWSNGIMDETFHFYTSPPTEKLELEFPHQYFFHLK